MSDQAVLDCFDTTIGRDLLRLVCGEVIDSGIGRTVYRCNLRPDLVLKFETESQSFQNVLEWDNWISFGDDPRVGPWLAPCVFISACGTVLAMERTIAPREKDYPEKLPAFLTDTKRRNYGMLNGKFVCHDYGIVNFTPPTRLRKADWWGTSS